LTFINWTFEKTEVSYLIADGMVTIPYGMFITLGSAAHAVEEATDNPSRMPYRSGNSYRLVNALLTRSLRLHGSEGAANFRRR
jgi:hypothetical protein